MFNTDIALDRVRRHGRDSIARMQRKIDNLKEMVKQDQKYTDYLHRALDRMYKFEQKILEEEANLLEHIHKRNHPPPRTSKKVAKVKRQGSWDNNGRRRW